MSANSNKGQFAQIASRTIAAVVFLLPFTAFALGAIVGSFLNVVIYRYPRHQSIVFPASHCGSCNAPIKPYDNVPILSYLWLRGRCRACKAPFSLRYPLVELANALFYLAVYQRTGPTVVFVPVAAVVSMFIILIYIDAEIQILPDVVTYPGIAIGIATSFISPLAHDLILASSWLDSVLGAVLGAALLSFVILAYWLIRKVQGMGWGDVSMIAMIGALLGASSVPGVLLLASIAGAIIGLPLALRHERGMQVALPFGVFLGFATLGVLFFGRTLWTWYAALLLR
ncbi:MAG TPA: prepilin peptidase [Thermoanaerobaculia bacterium]|nr:prepilin peptidase [Thermoanaerobaculia bacterium]